MRRFVANLGVLITALACGVICAGCKYGNLEESREFRPLPKWVIENLGANTMRDQVYFSGTLRCSNHIPAHAAETTVEMRKLVDQFQCASWTFRGVVADNEKDFEKAMERRQE
ncbi:MAG: hypothetical protein ACKVS9_06330 [Phycisphaerae bacterium]